MPFQFSLQPVLRLYAGHERMERLRLLTIAAALVRIRQEIAAIDRENLRIRQSVQTKMASGLAAAELHFELMAETVRLERKRLFLGQAADLEKKQQTQRKIYDALPQKPKVFQNLREQQREEYRVIESRREQGQLDEMFLLTRNHVGTAEPE